MGKSRKITKIFALAAAAAMLVTSVPVMGPVRRVRKRRRLHPGSLPGRKAMHTRQTGMHIRFIRSLSQLSTQRGRLLFCPKM